MTKKGTLASTSYVPLHVHPCDVALVLCMGQDHSLGEKSPLRWLMPELIRDIATMYGDYFWKRPWESREKAEAEERFSSGMCTVAAISKALLRCEGDVMRKLGIHDRKSDMDEDAIRELERSIRKGNVICDVENWGGAVLLCTCAIMPSTYGMTGGHEVCDFDDLPTRLKTIMMARKAVHDPDNVLGWGSVTFSPRTM